MTWAIFYLVCFVVGVTLSVLSFVGGTWHLPHMHLHMPHGGHAAASHAGTAAHGGDGSDMPFFNFATITAFLAWFGGSGYLLTRYSGWVVTAVLLVAIVLGLLGAGVVFLFVVKFLMAHSHELDPADYEHVGALGRITSSIRAGGTGEITFSLGGTRQVCGARSESGEALGRGAEVIVTRYERGIAYVRRYDDMAGEQPGNPALSS
jgi:hypothetical protein